MLCDVCWDNFLITFYIIINHYLNLAMLVIKDLNTIIRLGLDSNLVVNIPLFHNSVVENNYNYIKGISD